MAQENVKMQANGMGRTRRMEGNQGKQGDLEKRTNWKT